MRSILRPILTLLFCIVFYICLMPTAFADTVALGTCGDQDDNLTWTLYSNGELIIDGTGSMKRYRSEKSVPWYQYRHLITAITIKPGVLSIGDCAFCECDQFTEIYIPQGVTSIGDYAFAACEKLASVSIPDSLTDTGWFTFMRCTSLTSVLIPEGMTSISFGVFEDCSNLISVTIPISVTEIEERAFNRCSRLTDVTIPSGVTTIGNAAFSGCSGLSNLTIPSSVISIGDSAFSYCTGLTNVTIQEGITTLGSYTFVGCTGLTSITIPSTVISMIHCFGGCSSLTEILVDEGNHTYCDINGALLNKNGTEFIRCPEGLQGWFTVPEGIITINEDAFEGCSGLKCVTIPASVLRICSDAFNDCTGITDVYYECTSDKWTEVTVSGGNGPLTNATLHCSIDNGFCGKNGDNMIWNLYDNSLLIISGKGEMIDFSSVFSEEEWKSSSDLINTIKINEGVNTIGDYAFSACQQLISVIIPESVIKIGISSFNACNSMSSVKIPKNVSDIGYAAFSSSYNLEKIIVDDENASYCDVDGVLFDKTMKTIIQFPRGKAKDKAYSIPDGVEKIGDGTFSLCTNLTNVTIPASVEEIGSWAFFQCKNLTIIALPDNLKTIGYEAFVGCENLAVIQIPKNVMQIGDSAFRNCINLASVTIENGVANIGKESFYRCDSLTNIAIPSSVESIGQNAFYFAEIEVDKQNMNYCDIDGALFNKDATEILYVPKNRTGIYIIPETVKHIGDKCFLQCENVTGIVIPHEVISIGTQSFEQCKNLKSIVIPDKVISINAATFYGCDSLENIVISVSLDYIGDGAFNECGCLKNVYYAGTQTRWTEITIKQGNELLNNAIIHYDFHPDLILPESLKTLENEAFIGSAFTYVKLSERAVSIGWRTFADCPYLIAIYIPAATKVIDPQAFGDMQALTIFSKAGSTAETYAQEHGFSFIAVS